MVDKSRFEAPLEKKLFDVQRAGISQYASVSHSADRPLGSMRINMLMFFKKKTEIHFRDIFVKGSKLYQRIFR